MKALLLFLLSATLINCQSSAKKNAAISKEAKPGTNLSLAKAGLSEKDVVDAYVYVLGRYLVIRQERLDIADKNLGYNKIKYVPLAKANTVNPNLDVAYSEAWLAVDERSCQILEVPKISDRYYTVQILDEWANIITNINERNFPYHPYGKFSFCLKGAGGTPPADTVRIELPSEKAKLVARVERKGSEAETVRLQKGFKLMVHQASEDLDENSPQKIPMFTNDKLIRVEAFERPMVEQVLKSAPDTMLISKSLHSKVRAVADYIVQNETNKEQIDELIQDKAIPQFQRQLTTIGERKNGWMTTSPYGNGFGEDYWFRSAMNFAGIWWNVAKEVTYYSSTQDSEDQALSGDSTYILFFDKDSLPSLGTRAFWSMTLLSFPEMQVVPNEARRYGLGSHSKLTYGRDGSLTLAVGAMPKSNIPLTNWIPGPAGKNFAVKFRMYVPTDDVLSTRWYVPPLIKVQGFELQRTSSLE